MNFLICDENKADALYLKDLLKYEFLFLNIKLENKNGIELGIQIKEEFPNLHIILTSAYKEYLEDGYKTKADRFFVKPIHPYLFKTEMKNLLLSYNQEEPVFYDYADSVDAVFPTNFFPFAVFATIVTDRDFVNRPSAFGNLRRNLWFHSKTIGA